MHSFEYADLPLDFRDFDFTLTVHGEGLRSISRLNAELDIQNIQFHTCCPTPHPTMVFFF